MPSATKSTRVVVTNFVQLEQQDFAHESSVAGNLIVERWREAPGVHDISRHVAAGLETAGFTASYQPGETGDFYVQGIVSRFERTWSTGRLLWGVFGGMLTPFSLCIIPLYFRGMDHQVLVTFTVFDAQGNKIATRREPIRFTNHSTCPWGAHAFTSHTAVGQAAGAVTALFVANAQSSNASLQVAR